MAATPRNYLQLINTKNMYLKYLVPTLSFCLLTACHKEEKKETQMPEMPIDVALVETDSVVLSKTYPGWVDARDATAVVARVNGYITSVDYDGGQIVEKGKVLYTIEDTQYRDAVEQAAAQLESAKSQYAYAKDHYAALQKAAQSDAVSQMEVLQGKSAMEQAHAAIRNAQAALETAKTKLSYCTIRATHKGHIAATNSGVGVYVNGEASPFQLSKIYDNSLLHAKFNIEDEQYLRMLAGRKEFAGVDLTHVPIHFQELIDVFYGDLAYQAPVIDRETGTLRLECEVLNPDDILKDGMYCTIKLPYAIDPNAMLVKDASLGTDQLGRYLYVVNDSNKVVYTPVKVGDIVRDSMRIITSGVQPGQKYVTKALMKVHNGMTIKPVVQN